MTARRAALARLLTALELPPDCALAYAEKAEQAQTAGELDAIIHMIQDEIGE